MAISEQIEELEKLPFAISKRLRALWEKIRDVVLTKDTVKIIILYGMQGCGKSVCAQKAAYIINGGMLDKEQVTFDKAQFIRALLHYRKKPLLADEGVSVFFSHNTMTKDGRVMSEVCSQWRQQNLVIFILIWDVLLVSKEILKQADVIGLVYESEALIGGSVVPIKGNLLLYPNFKKTVLPNGRIVPGKDYRQQILRYERLKRLQESNPLIKNPFPKPWHMEPGEPYDQTGERFKGAFYAVDREWYINQKASVLRKFDKSFERKKPNRSIDYPTMDALIKQRVAMPKIAKMLNCSVEAVKLRKAKGRNKVSSKAKHRHKAPVRTRH